MPGALEQLPQGILGLAAERDLWPEDRSEVIFTPSTASGFMALRISTASSSFIWLSKGATLEALMALYTLMRFLNRLSLTGSRI